MIFVNNCSYFHIIMFLLLQVLYVTKLRIISAKEFQISQCFYNQTSDPICFYSNGPFGTVNTFSEGEKQCKRNNLTMLEVRDGSMQLILNEFIREQTSLHMYYIYLDMMRADTQWKWLDGNLYNGSLLELGNIEPVGFIVRNNTGLRIGSYNYAELSFFICQYQGTCSNQKYSYQYDNHCFVNFEIMKNWFDSAMFCEYYGGQLAVFSNIQMNEINNIMVWVLNFELNANYWIGLIRSDWIWQNNPVILPLYYNWFYGYPRFSFNNSYRCAVFQGNSNNNTWMDHICLDDNIVVVCMTNFYNNSMVTSYLNQITSQFSITEQEKTVSLNLFIGVVIGICICLIIAILSIILLVIFFNRYNSKKKFTNQDLGQIFIKNETEDKIINNSTNSNLTNGGESGTNNSNQNYDQVDFNKNNNNENYMTNQGNEETNNISDVEPIGETLDAVLQIHENNNYTSVRF